MGRMLGRQKTYLRSHKLILSPDPALEIIGLSSSQWLGVSREFDLVYLRSEVAGLQNLRFGQCAWPLSVASQFMLQICRRRVRSETAFLKSDYFKNNTCTS
jgi:hypothetical protein